MIRRKAPPQANSARLQLRLSMLLAAVLISCQSPPGPPSTPPLDAEVPERFAADEGPAEDIDLVHAWWHDFDDPALVALIEEALRHNHDLAAAAQRVLAARAAIGVSGSARLPQLNAKAQATRTRQVFPGIPIPGAPDPLASTTTQFTYGVEAGWELDLWGRLAALEEAGEAEARSSEASLEAARLSLIGLVARAWFAAEASRREVAVLERTVATYQRTLEITEQRVNAGLRPSLENDLARANLSDAEARLAGARERWERQRRSLETLAGRYPAGELTLAGPARRSLPPVPTGLPADLVRRRPDLIAIEQRLRAAGARAFASRQQLLPTLRLSGSIGILSTEPGDLSDTDFGIWSLAGGLLQPLFTGNRIEGEIARDEALRDELSERWASALLNAFREVETTLAASGHIERRSEAVERARDAARSAETAARDRYEGGLENLLTVLESERRALTAELTLVAVEKARLTNRVALYQSLGGGRRALPPDATLGAAPARRFSIEALSSQRGAGTLGLR